MPIKPRRVFFSLHYQKDIWRAQQVRQHWATKDTRLASGFFDGSLEEAAKKNGGLAVKRMINAGLVGASTLCVLIGAETYSRRWVHYEIFKSIEEGMGVFGVRIHGLKNSAGYTAVRGTDPFAVLGYGTQSNSEKMWPKVHYTTGWRDAPQNEPISETCAPYLNRADRPVLSSLFKVYDWVNNNGYENFPAWVAKTASQAGR